jgi:CHAT domain-containing protein
MNSDIFRLAFALEEKIKIQKELIDKYEQLVKSMKEDYNNLETRYKLQENIIRLMEEQIKDLKIIQGIWVPKFRND